jgi:hypothetical protein
MHIRTFGSLFVVGIGLLMVAYMFGSSWFRASSTLSGTYVFHNDISVGWLKFKNDVKDDKLVADIQSVEMAADGHLITRMGVAYGTIKDDTASLSLQFTDMYGVGLSYVGKATKEKLVFKLIGAGRELATHEFVRADMTEYVKWEQKLKEKALKIIEKEKEKERQKSLLKYRDESLKRMGGAVLEMNDVFGKADLLMSHTAGIAKGFAENTEKSRALRQRLAHTKDETARHDLVSELERMVVDTEQVNLEVNTFRNGYSAQVNELKVKLVDAVQACQNYRKNVPNLDAWCDKFLTTKQQFEAKLQEVEQWFRQLNILYGEEIKKQQEMASHAAVKAEQAQ